MFLSLEDVMLYCEAGARQKGVVYANVCERACVHSSVLLCARVSDLTQQHQRPTDPMRVPRSRDLIKGEASNTADTD